MLVIAGGVSGVLLSRGSDVISDLENTDTNVAQIDSEEKCKEAAESLTGTTVTKSAAAPAATDKNEYSWVSPKCTINGIETINAGFSETACEQYRSSNGVRGVFSDGDGTNAETCVIG